MTPKTLETIEKIRQLSHSLTIKEIAQKLSLSYKNTYKLAKLGNIPAVDGRKIVAAAKKQMFPCVVCGTLFYEKRHRYENGTRRTCSKSCSSILRSQTHYKKADKAQILCAVCNKSFTTKPSKAQTTKYCSKECRVFGSSYAFNNIDLLEKYKILVQEGKTFEQISDIVQESANAINTIVNKYKIAGEAYTRRPRSHQEAVVMQYIGEVLQEPIDPPGRYPNSRYIYDGKCSMGYIEYDGRGGHYRPDQLQRDNLKDSLDLDRPIIRITPQAYYGKHDYLNWLLKKIATGYVSANVRDYTVKILHKTHTQLARRLLRDCHALGVGSGKILFGLFYKDLLIGVSQWGPTTDRFEEGLELRRFFVLDSTPKNTESWFLSKSMNALGDLGHKKLITYCHEWERGSYLLATGWQEVERKRQEYDYYMWNGRVFSRRVWWSWAKKAGLVDQLGTAKAKIALAQYLGATIIYEGTKKKFVKTL